jgi:hypothetical protein
MTTMVTPGSPFPDSLPSIASTSRPASLARRPNASAGQIRAEPAIFPYAASTFLRASSLACFSGDVSPHAVRPRPTVTTTAQKAHRRIGIPVLV